MSFDVIQLSIKEGINDGCKRIEEVGGEREGVGTNGRDDNGTDALTDLIPHLKQTQNTTMNKTTYTIINTNYVVN